MFAVEGWKLGPVVAETAPKKKLKRKRDDEGTTSTADKPNATIRRNPFAIRGQQGSKASRKSLKAKQHETIPLSMTENMEDTKKTESSAEFPITERQKARRKAEKRRQRKLEKQATNTEDSNSKSVHIATQPEPTTTTLTPLQQKMRAKLTGSQFRQINEKLYTTHSSEALSLFKEQPLLFDYVFPSII
jgi:ribosomal RNA-processing protein 8